MGAALLLGSLVRPDDERGRKRCVNDTLERVAARLGHTPAMCRKSYVHPTIVESFLAGSPCAPPRRLGGEDPLSVEAMRGCEKTVARFLAGRRAPVHTPRNAMSPPRPIDADAHRRLVDAHRARRDARYRSPDGWLTLVDRIALDEGDNRLPIGTIRLAGDAAPRLEPAAGVTRAGAPLAAPIDLAPDDGVPLELDGRRYLLGRRGDGLVVRVRDPRAPALAAFAGIPAFDIDPAFRVAVELEPIDPPRVEVVATTDGGVDELPCVGLARFELGGVAQSLGVFAESGGRLVVPFADPTNRETSYGGGRMLYVERPAAGEPWVIDFNLAFNPPCAFNDLVACPMPPAMNRLTVPIVAGERRPSG